MHRRFLIYQLIISLTGRIFPGMEESGSEGLDDLIKSEVGGGLLGLGKKFFDGVDAVCIVSPPIRTSGQRSV